MRRPVVAIFVALLACASFGQRRDGIFQKVAWSINDHHTLLWNGLPYVPNGIRIDGNPAAVEAGNQAKISDFIVDLPENGNGWEATIAALESHKDRYLIRINSLAPMATGFVIEPQGYRIPGIVKPTTVTVDLPGAQSALVVLASRRDGTIDKKERVPVINGKLTYAASPGPQFEHVLLIYPQMESLSQPDYWEGYDAHRDTLLATLKRAPLGAGFRGIVNPLGSTVSLAPEQNRFVPTSDLFRMELRNYVEQKYKSVQTLTRSWSITGSDLQSFEAIVRLVPLWNGERGVAALFDPSTNKLYPTDRRYSTAWTDIEAVINDSAARRYARLVTGIRSVADVPVIQDWNGWAQPVEAEIPALDGLGIRSTGTTPSQIIESSSRAASSIMRWKTNGWLVATNIDLGGKDAASQVGPVINDLGSLGARGYFIQSTDPSVLAAVAQVPSQDILAQTSPTGVFYPENATNPANPQRLTNGNWWLPTPAAGNRIDLGPDFYAYRLADQTAIWAKTPGRYKLKMLDAKKATFTTVDGTDPKPKYGKNDVEVNLTELPLLITGTSSIPVPELAFKSTVKEFDDLLAAAAEQHRDSTTERLTFRNHLNGFEADPGANFPFMREQVYLLGFRVTNYLWIEAERPKATNFSEVDSLPGASGLSALVLDTKIEAGAGEGYYADYQVPVLTNAEQEVWIAARIPEERRGDVTVAIADQILKFPQDYVALYGQGLAWYKLGTTVLKGNMTNVRIQVNSGGAPIAFDAILLTPIPFTPSATVPPRPIIKPAPK